MYMIVFTCGNRTEKRYGTALPLELSGVVLMCDMSAGIVDRLPYKGTAMDESKLCVVVSTHSGTMDGTLGDSA